MASVTNRPNGHRWIQYKTAHGTRSTIRLGKVTPAVAEQFRQRIDELIVANELKTKLSVDMQMWINGLGETFHAKLVAAGLVPPRTLRTVGELTTAWLSDSEWGTATRMSAETFVASFERYFGRECLLSAIDDTKAKEFRDWLHKHGAANDGKLSKATVSRRIRWARQLLTFAVKKNAVGVSPFAGVSGYSEVNRSRDFFVQAEVIELLMTKTVDAEFCAILALARYGAVRCPSEVLPFEWTQINWETNTMVIKAPKTKHHEGHEQRTVPIFPELRRRLADLWESIDEGRYLFPQHRRKAGATLTNKLETLCMRAGVKMWAKPWQNMRSTRETEWLRAYPINVVAEWLGHSPLIALKHYAQVESDQAAKAAANAFAAPNCQGTAKLPTMGVDSASLASLSARDSKSEVKGEARHGS